MKNFLTILAHVISYGIAGYAVYKDPSLAVPVITAVGASSVLPSMATAVKNSVPPSSSSSK